MATEKGSELVCPWCGKLLAVFEREVPEGEPIALSDLKAFGGFDSTFPFCSACGRRAFFEIRVDGRLTAHFFYEGGRSWKLHFVIPEEEREGALGDVTLALSSFLIGDVDRCLKAFRYAKEIIWGAGGCEARLTLGRDGEFLLKVRKGEAEAELHCCKCPPPDNPLGDPVDALVIRPFGPKGPRVVVRDDKSINEFLDWLERFLN